ncbi:hypothetical protein RFI_14222 [Reticulomyxa filosa]|uniref:Fibronectin type-III domain-containing protein n=1 Tax=Reticulomyxa filosa TaxID=46433 RepID=X6NB38_RETFI|nr:hypothetical protein RFI_14222 [Reticulomyxa filosa]|eukprot:ETO22969.1 hypothetical protein RFI_14222 [Reticulomyxa filosa]
MSSAEIEPGIILSLLSTSIISKKQNTEKTKNEGSDGVTVRVHVDDGTKRKEEYYATDIVLKSRNYSELISSIQGQLSQKFPNIMNNDDSSGVQWKLVTYGEANDIGNDEDLQIEFMDNEETLHLLTIRVFVDDGTKTTKSECRFKDIRMKTLDYDQLMERIKLEFANDVPHILRNNYSPNLKWKPVSFKEASKQLQECSNDVDVMDTDGLQEEMFNSDDESDASSNGINKFLTKSIIYMYIYVYDCLHSSHNLIIIKVTITPTKLKIVSIDTTRIGISWSVEHFVLKKIESFVNRLNEKSSWKFCFVSFYFITKLHANTVYEITLRICIDKTVVKDLIPWTPPLRVTTLKTTQDLFQSISIPRQPLFAHVTKLIENNVYLEWEPAVFASSGNEKNAVQIVYGIREYYHNKGRIIAKAIDTHSAQLKLHPGSDYLVTVSAKNKATNEITKESPPVMFQVLSAEQAKTFGTQTMPSPPSFVCIFDDSTSPTTPMTWVCWRSPFQSLGEISYEVQIGSTWMPVSSAVKHLLTKKNSNSTLCVRTVCQWQSQNYRSKPTESFPMVW